VPEELAGAACGGLAGTIFGAVLLALVIARDQPPTALTSSRRGKRVCCETPRKLAFLQPKRGSLQLMAAGETRPDRIMTRRTPARAVRDCQGRAIMAKCSTLHVRRATVARRSGRTGFHSHTFATRALVNMHAP
jgi:hypothetical protein